MTMNLKLHTWLFDKSLPSCQMYVLFVPVLKSALSDPDGHNGKYRMYWTSVNTAPIVFITTNDAYIQICKL
jgi:hypothetical protein